MFRKTRHRASTLSSPGTSLQEKDFIVQVEPPKTIACSICQAVYTPSAQQQERASSAASPELETAFERVCHFCFRCQRQACPQCWNPVHHVCASCGEEAQLPFRSPVPSLEGLVLFPNDDSSPLVTQSSVQAFICVHNGRFYTPMSAHQHSHSHSHSQEPALAKTPDQAVEGVNAHSPFAQTSSSPAQEIYPSWIQEIMGYKPGDQVAQHTATPLQSPTHNSPEIEYANRAMPEEQMEFKSPLQADLLFHKQVINGSRFQEPAQAAPREQVKPQPEHMNTMYVDPLYRKRAANSSEYQPAGRIVSQEQVEFPPEHPHAAHAQTAAPSHNQMHNRPAPAYEDFSWVEASEGFAEAPHTRRLQWTPDYENAAPHTRRLEWEPEPSIPAPQPDFFPHPGEVYGTATALPDEIPPTSGDARVIERIENILIVITSTILMLLILVIVLAMSSINMNTLFLHLLHIDIRGEIAYLLQLV